MPASARQYNELVMSPTETVHPVVESERIHSVDALRGFSLLGILLLNIVSFGMPFAAYMSPAAYGGAEGVNFTTWLIAMTFWDGKMRCIFSMLFGTGTIILLERAEKRGAGIAAADIYFRRTMWLILFGLFHAHLIWGGDILYSYGVIGLLLFPFRKASAYALILTGIILIVAHSLQNVGGAIALREVAAKAKEAKAIEARGVSLTPEQKKSISEWNSVAGNFAPSKKEIDEELADHRGGWIRNLKRRSGEAMLFEFTMFFQIMFLDVLGMLIMGMGLAKAGVFDASRSYRFYTAMIAVGFGLGLPLNYLAATKWAAAHYNFPDYLGYVGSTSDPGRFLVAGAYIGCIMIAVKLGWRWLTVPLANVGRTALSNYLLTSILCTWFFNGYGLGYFGKLERYQLYWVVLVVWTINLVWSPLWLRNFRYGPAEWLWRSLTYWRMQPMRKY